MRAPFIVLSLLVVLTMPRAVCSQNVQTTLTVEGEVLKPLRLSLKDLNTFAPVEIKASDKDGAKHTFKGVRLFDILDSAGVAVGKQLRGENLAKYVLIKAQEGYEVIFALPEIDPEFTSQIILLAYEVDGKALPEGEGPFRMVVPNDKKHARWIRKITTIKIMFTKS